MKKKVLVLLAAMLCLAVASFLIMTASRKPDAGVAQRFLTSLYSLNEEANYEAFVNASESEVQNAIDKLMEPYSAILTSKALEQIVTNRLPTLAYEASLASGKSFTVDKVEINDLKAGSSPNAYSGTFNVVIRVDGAGDGAYVYQTGIINLAREGGLWKVDYVKLTGKSLQEQLN